MSGCSADGSAPRSGRGGRRFKSSHPDHLNLYIYGTFPLSSKEDFTTNRGVDSFLQLIIDALGRQFQPENTSVFVNQYS